MISISTRKLDAGSVKNRIAWILATLLVVGVPFSRANESSYQEKPSESVKMDSQNYETLARRRAFMTERRMESEKLNELLKSDASGEEKRKAVDAFRFKQEAWQAEMLSDIPEPTLQEKAAKRQRMKEWVSRLPDERRKVMEAQLVISEEMEKLRDEEGRLSPEEQRTRMQALMDRRRKAMQAQVAAMETMAARESKNIAKAHRSPFQQAMEAEKQKLDAALATNDPEKRRAAMESFRAAIEKMRAVRMQEMEQRRNAAVRSSSEPQNP